LALTHAPFRAARILAQDETGKFNKADEDSQWEGMGQHFVKKARLNEEGQVEE